LKKSWKNWTVRLARNPSLAQRRPTKKPKGALSAKKANKEAQRRAKRKVSMKSKLP